MKFEFSAGGVVYKRGTTPRRTRITQNQDDVASNATGRENILILLGKHSQHHGWVFPKGLIGDHKENENKEETAIREVREETGITAKILKPLTPVTFWYQFKGEKIKKTVYYFLMEYISGEIKDHDWEMEDVKWVAEEKVEGTLTYNTDKKVWHEAKELIASSVST